MAKRREIKFRPAQDRLIGIGRQGGMTFHLYESVERPAGEPPPYFVRVLGVAGMLKFSTAGREYFPFDAAKRLCEKIAAGEVTVAELQARYDAKDAAAQRAADQESVKRAKAFLPQLEAEGITYHKLLELEMLAHGLGEAGRQALLAYERGEGWPDEA
ncbi:MAG: hypothetical protein K2K53_05345 [Oscillospiraceae bacterium]|nr:hypothetical protein [Oscillospiraceae bacterium]